MSNGGETIAQYGKLKVKPVPVFKHHTVKVCGELK
jgi:hypothetical protein